jgi:short/branched chain acyl-CoA dehydrogenase
VDLTLDTDEQALADLARDYAQRKLAPVAHQSWLEGTCRTDLLREIGKLGLLGLLIPEEWDGAGASTVGFVSAIEAIGSVDQSFAAAVQAHSTIGSLPLALYGSDSQRDRWLRPLARGEVLGAFGLTEPGAGSDAQGIATRAERRDGGWLINGRKAFISNAGTDMSFGVTLLARTGQREDGTLRFGTFIVEKGTEGFALGPRMRGIGWRGLDTRELSFDDVWVSDDHVLGDPDLGLQQFLSTLEVGRISVAALSVSLTAGVLELARQYASNRQQFGKPIADFQAIQFKLARMATGLEAARLLTYQAAARRDLGLPVRKHAAMAKLFSSEVAVESASEAVQIFGGTGYMLDAPVARFYCDAKVLEIGEGTNEIQHVVIARSLDD